MCITEMCWRWRAEFLGSFYPWHWLRTRIGWSPRPSRSCLLCVIQCASCRHGSWHPARYVRGINTNASDALVAFVVGRRGGRGRPRGRRERMSKASRRPDTSAGLPASVQQQQQHQNQPHFGIRSSRVRFSSFSSHFLLSARVLSSAPPDTVATSSTRRAASRTSTKTSGNETTQGIQGRRFTIFLLTSTPSELHILPGSSTWNRRQHASRCGVTWGLHARPPTNPTASSDGSFRALGDDPRHGHQENRELSSVMWSGCVLSHGLFFLRWVLLGDRERW